MGMAMGWSECERHLGRELEETGLPATAQEDGRTGGGGSHCLRKAPRASDSPVHAFLLQTLPDSCPGTCWGPSDRRHIPRDTWGGKGPEGGSAVTPGCRGASQPGSPGEAPPAPGHSKCPAKSRRLKGGRLCAALKGQDERKRKDLCSGRRGLRAKAHQSRGTGLGSWSLARGLRGES